jgi:hypothetical protein
MGGEEAREARILFQEKKNAIFGRTSLLFFSRAIFGCTLYFRMLPKIDFNFF